MFLLLLRSHKQTDLSSLPDAINLSYYEMATEYTQSLCFPIILYFDLSVKFQSRIVQSLLPETTNLSLLDIQTMKTA